MRYFIPVSCVVLVGLISLSRLGASAMVLLPERVVPVVADRQDFQIPDRVQFSGFIGQRVAGNEAERLARIDPDRLLEGYRKRPGRQAWDGEHVGKWIHAATLAWVNTGDAALRAKLDATVAALLECQLADGYLGTYAEGDRWTEWDVWAHKYNLIGLITYIRYTGNETPLATCRRMADMLCANLGDGSGQRDILTAGSQHVGMASTSVLEPMVLLYRLTGEPRYLEFCRYIVRAWELPHGPHILSSLLAGKGVNRVGNGKAYEMLSCLNGALELYRTTGDEALLRACLHAWQDIVDQRLYLTGTASSHECFQGDHELPPAENTGETCVTVTWLQFNAQLLRLTGEARFAEQLERTVLNQLFGAQRPDCRAWGYYVQMEGRKPYSDSLDGHCCLSSGPRGVALIPTFALATDADGVVCNLYDSGRALLTLRDGSAIALRLTTDYPAQDQVNIEVNPAGERRFALKLRIPHWCEAATLAVNDHTEPLVVSPDGYAIVQRTWQRGDRVALTLPFAPRLIMGEHVMAGRAAVVCGPLVYALDEASLASAGQLISTVTFAGATTADLDLRRDRATQQIQASVIARRHSTTATAGDVIAARLLPFAQAGASGAAYRVWVPVPASGEENIAPFGTAFASEPGLACAVINDQVPATHGSITQVASGEECWFAVRLDAPADLRRFAFVHGRGFWVPGKFEQPGWFAVVPRRPRVEVQVATDGPWVAVGEFSDYPPATMEAPLGLNEGRRFELVLAKPVRAIAFRVVGRPARAHAGPLLLSCGELEAFGTAAK